MSIKLVLTVGLVVLTLGCFFYLKNVRECFGGTGALKLPQLSEIKKNEAINIKFKMLRIAAPGCFKGHSSDSYKNVSCGYRFNSSDNWILGKLIATVDNETEYEVECQIPPIRIETAIPSQLEYYFEYSPWGKPPERKTGLLPIR